MITIEGKCATTFEVSELIPVAAWLRPTELCVQIPLFQALSVFLRVHIMQI
jgi:hypothetical protein